MRVAFFGLPLAAYLLHRDGARRFFFACNFSCMRSAT